MDEQPAAELASSGKPTIGVFGLISIGFFWVSGGIYGNEEMSKTAPSLYAFSPTLFCKCAAIVTRRLPPCNTPHMYVMLGIIVCPLFYAFPVALMTAELSTALPGDGGFVVWVQKAFSDRLSNHVAWWTACVFLVDAAVYPVLAAQYRPRTLATTPLLRIKLASCAGTCCRSLR
jgi:amino acid transporter